MILDGDPIPEQSSEIFRRVVQRDVAIREAAIRTQSESCNPARSFANWFTLIISQYGMYQMVKGMASGRPDRVARCNFDIGELWNVVGLVRANPDLDFEGWGDLMPDLRDADVGHYGTTAPLPRWDEFRLQVLRAPGSDFQPTYGYSDRS
ncbi:hypothetical protein OQA88_3304 [Cercophora sp. LCS_1]